jgi:uncharacterized protein involved in exopolysaccharide biosynthesis
MADQIQRVVQGMAAPAPVHPAMMRMAPPAVAAVSLTPKEIVGILRRHLLMILLFTLTGLVAGIGGYFVMRLYFPKYTAITGITVLPPGTDPPRGFNAGQPQKDLYYQFRFTKASLMKQQDMMQMLIAQDTIRETTWFGRFQKRNAAGEVIKTNIPKAIDDLDKKLGASAPRDQDFIRVSMTCGDPKEAARIVNEMVRLFMNDQREKARSGIAEQMTSEERLRQDLRTTLKSIQDRLDGLRTGSEFGRLNFV